MKIIFFLKKRGGGGGVEGVSIPKIIAIPAVDPELHVGTTFSPEGCPSVLWTSRCPLNLLKNSQKTFPLDAQFSFSDKSL